MNTIDKEELRKLIEAIQSGAIERHDLDAFIPALGLNSACNQAHAAYNGSLDAAKGFHEELLPGWLWFGGYLDGPVEGYCFTVVEEPFVDAISFRGFNEIHARAWLLATLKAVAASK